MEIHFDAQSLEAVTVCIGAGLAVVMRDDDTVDHESTAHELVAQTQHIDVIGDAKVAAHLVLLDVNSADDDDNLCHVAQLGEHLQLDVRLETRQNTTRVEVIEQLPAKFQIKFMTKFCNTLFDVLRLYLEVFLAIEPVFHSG